MHSNFAGLSREALIGLGLCAVATIVGAQEGRSSHFVPFFPAASDVRPEGFVRIVNNSDEAGTVTIVAVDDAGIESEELTLALEPNGTVGLDAGDLENGAPDSGLTGSTGAGQGDWRLRLTSDLDVEPQVFARTPDGGLWEMHETARLEDDRYHLATFNPGVNVNQVGRLRLVNPSDEAAAVTIRGTDDVGISPSPGVTLQIPPGEAETFTAAELESGVAPGLKGSLGDGAGKWRLEIESSDPISVMSLVASPTGHLTNLSAATAREVGGVHRVPLFPPASDTYGRQGFARVVNRSDESGDVRIEAFDATGWTYDPVTLTLDALETQSFNSEDLELGNANKGLDGSTGAGEGDWRLELTSDLDIEVHSYVRTVGGLGYVTPMHDTAVRETGGMMRYYVPVFHPPDHEGQESRLHLLNLGADDAQVGIGALDDRGEPPPEGDVSLVLAVGETRMLTAGQLENGDTGLDGRFGSGSGGWRLFVTAGGALQVMSLGYSPEGFLANLSRGRPATTTAVGLPDLVVQAPHVSTASPQANATFMLSATVANQGDGDADATTVRFHQSDNAHVSATDVEVGSDLVEALAAGKSSVESVSVTAPSEPGVYHYGACVDAVGNESDTANNCSSPVTVTVPEPPRPDLVVLSPSVSNTSPRAGDPITLSVTVRNDGDGDSGATTLRYHRSDDAFISTADALIGTDPVAGLAARDGSGESIDTNAPDAAGTHYYGACVDAVADESDTANNCSPPVRVDVNRPLAPDLDVSMSGHFTTEGAVFSVTVGNIGDGAAASTTLRLNRYGSVDDTTPDREDGSVSVRSLAPGEQLDHFLFTVTLERGSNHYRACVDPVPGESDTANNCSGFWSGLW